MKKLCSVVLNPLNNDSRVKKIGNTLSKYFEVRFTAVSNKYITKIFVTDTLENHKVHRIKYGTKKGNGQDVINNILQKKTSFNPFKLLKDIAWQIRLHYILFITLISENTDIYYCNDFNTLIAGYFASRRKRAKLIYDSHELWAERNGARIKPFKRLIEILLEWFFIRRCNLVITVSDGIANEMVKRYNIKQPLVIRNLDEEKTVPSYEQRMHLRDTLAIPRNCILIVYQGRLSAIRGIPELIDAISELPDNYHLLLMGSRAVKHSLDKIDKNKRIHYPGFVDEKILFHYTSIADIGIVPYRTSDTINYYLGFPNKFSQFLNAGIAVLLYDAPESRKIISTCKCGSILIKIEAGYIADCIQNISDDCNLKVIKQNARSCFIKYYNWNIDEKKLINTLRNIL